MRTTQIFNIAALATSLFLGHAAHAQPEKALPTATAAPAAVVTPAQPTNLTREAIVSRELLTTIASKVNEAELRAKTTETMISTEMGRMTWIATIGAFISILLAIGAGFGGFYLSRHLEKKREQELIDAGKEPLSVLVHRTRDEATRLAQRLQIAGLTETRLFKSLMDTLPALQTEAGKATFNLKRQIPKSEQSSLEGPAAPLDPVRKAIKTSPAPTSKRTES